ncbi:MAG TPA: energy-coupling factor transporter transmembrane component T [Anaerolineaceae bacterium]
MLVAWRYRIRNSVLEKIDPRTRWLVSFLILIAITQFWDIRFLLFFFVLVIFQYVLSRLTWRETFRAWLFILFFIVFIVGINTLISGRAGPTAVLQGTHTFWTGSVTLPLVNWTITINLTLEKLFFAMTQIVRMLSMAILFFIIPFTIDPRTYGISFSGLGMPDRFAFSMDLAFRFVPTLTRDFSVTLDAQRARGFEIEKLDGGIFAQIRKLAPLLVPVTMNAILSGEDITNAMDLRCFGLRKRTWAQALTYRWWDKALIAFGIVVAVASLVIRWGFGIGQFWMPDWFLNLI